MDRINVHREGLTVQVTLALSQDEADLIGITGTNKMPKGWRYTTSSTDNFDIYARSADPDTIAAFVAQAREFSKQLDDEYARLDSIAGTYAE